MSENLTDLLDCLPPVARGDRVSVPRETYERARAAIAELAAAEERGRRKGVEERDEYARALYDLFMSIPPPQNPRWQEAFTQALPLIGRIKRQTLAPRDSAPATSEYPGCGDPAHDCRDGVCGMGPAPKDRK